MVQYFDIPIKQSTKAFTEDEHNKGRTGLYNIKLVLGEEAYMSIH